jgi:glutamate/tyrosine decarboxylase-like PLP-dependent enzyme
MTLKEHGFEKFGRLVEQNVRQARYLAELVKAEPRLELMAPVALNVVPFRFVGPVVGPDSVGSPLNSSELDEVNRELLMRIQEQGIAVPSSTRVDGRFTIRVCICNHRSRREDFDLLVRETLRIGGEILDEAEQLQEA